MDRPSEYLSDTIANVFSNVYTVNVAGTTNCELFATENSSALDVLARGEHQLRNQELKNLITF